MLLPPPLATGQFTYVGEVLGSSPDAVFTCPVLGRPVAWAAKDVFNPGAVVRDGRVHLLVRAEDGGGPLAGTSRIGLASSDDGGRTFALRLQPVLYPDHDEWSAWEWPGGCEDPRLVESPDGGYVCCYSAFDGKSSCLMVATSDDLVHWHKRGPAFAGTRHARRWSKSGAIVTEVRDGRLQAARLDGRYLMYWGEGICFLATSEDLVHWAPVESTPEADRYVTADRDAAVGSLRIHRIKGQRVLRPLVGPRPGRFDELLVEPGPPAVVGDEDIVLIYNGGALQTVEDTVTGVAYQPGSVFFDRHEPGAVLARDRAPSPPTGLGTLEGQVDGVCFAQGLVLLDGQWLLFLGLADSRVGYATAPAGPSLGRGPDASTPRSDG